MFHNITTPTIQCQTSDERQIQECTPSSTERSLIIVSVLANKYYNTGKQKLEYRHTSIIVSANKYYNFSSSVFSHKVSPSLAKEH